MPTGPVPCRYLAIGEKPGQEEAYRGMVFQGKSGMEMNLTYLPLAGLDRDGCRFSNAVKCRLGGTNDKPTPEQIHSCAITHLPGEVNECKPEVIFLLGATPCSLVPGLEIEKDHGLPMWVERGRSQYFGQWEGWVWPMYHPAAGMHNTTLMIPQLEDWRHFHEWGMGLWDWKPTNYKPGYGYYLIDSDERFEQSLEETDGSECYQDWVAVDTENDGRRPWSFQYSFMPGSGFLIRAADKRRLQEFHRRYKNREWWMHNEPHDLDVMVAMGLPDKLRTMDTMQRAFQQGNVPQGLKALAWRWLGIKMRDWEDVVSPPSRKKMVAWLTQAWLDLADSRERVEKPYKKPLKMKAGLDPSNFMLSPDGSMRLGTVEYKPIKPERDCKRIISHSHKPTYDLWKRSEEAGLIGRGVLAETLTSWDLGNGPNPIMSIANCDLADAIQYACMDADIQGQVGLMAKKKLEEVMAGWKIAEEDCDH